MLVVHSYLDALEYLVNCFCECQLNVGADICQAPGFITDPKWCLQGSVQHYQMLCQALDKKKKKIIRLMYKVKT